MNVEIRALKSFIKKSLHKAQVINFVFIDENCITMVDRRYGAEGAYSMRGIYKPALSHERVALYTGPRNI